VEILEDDETFEKASSCMEDLRWLDSINSKEERPRKP
jgi:hypothetical protein